MNYQELMALVAREGDEKHFEYKGYRCRISRVGKEYSGHLCGYIEIPTWHALYEMDYDEIERRFNYELPAHGGLTFSGYVQGRYWIGFDCAHFGDLRPFSRFVSNECEGYRDMNYVESNIKQIIDFIIQAGIK